MKTGVTPRIDTPLGRFIVNKMIDLNISWAHMAVETGLSVEGIKRMCSKQGNPSRESLEKIASALKVDLETLVANIGAGHQPTHSPEVKPDRANSLWEAYLSIAKRVVESDLPKEIKPTPSDIAAMACQAVSEPG